MSQVEDFYEFRQHLENSLQEGLATIEILRMSLLTGTLGATGVNTAVQRLAELLKASPGESLQAGLSARLHQADEPRLVSAATDSFPDHRDFKTLPDYQPRESRSIWTQTEMGPRSDVSPFWRQLLREAGTDLHIKYAGCLAPSHGRSVPALLAAQSRRARRCADSRVGKSRQTEA